MKLLPAVCVVSLYAGIISVRADDTPVQAAARAALEQKLSEQDNSQAQPPPVLVTPSGATVVQPGQTATNGSAAVPTTPVTPQTAPAAVAPTPAQPAVAPAMTEASPAPATTGANDTPAQAAARAALEEKMNATDNSQTQSPPALVTPAPAETKPAETATAPVPAGTTSAPMETPPAASAPAPVPAPAATVVVPSPAQTGVPNPPDQVTAVVPGKALGLKSIEAPNVPISANQQAQLQALLIKYKANQITPQEYHKRRAEILAQPQP